MPAVREVRLLHVCRWTRPVRTLFQAAQEAPATPPMIQAAEAVVAVRGALLLAPAALVQPASLAAMAALAELEQHREAAAVTAVAALFKLSRMGPTVASTAEAVAVADIG